VIVNFFDKAKWELTSQRTIVARNIGLPSSEVIGVFIFLALQTFSGKISTQILTSQNVFAEFI